jgi:cytochrome c oxidase subunit 3
MVERSAIVSEPFDEPAQQLDAATFGMWVFLASEILFFGGLFLAYTVYRHSYPAPFAEAGRRVKILYGTANTALLLTSSLTMSLAIHAAQEGRRRPLIRFLVATILLGCCFLTVKGFEYKSDITEHLVPGRHFTAGLPAQTQLFWFLYWMATGVHSIHLLAGIIVLACITRLAGKRCFSVAHHNPVLISGLYWHFVDLVWVWLYALFYLVNRH